MSSAAYASYRGACFDRAVSARRYRLPRSEILLFNEGSSAARWLSSRLIPSHKDSRQWQELTFPQLQSLTAEQRTELEAKFLPTDEQSFVQYYAKLFKQK